MTDGHPQRREVAGRAAGNLEELLLDASETALTEETYFGCESEVYWRPFPRAVSVEGWGEVRTWGFGGGFVFLFFVAAVHKILVPQPMQSLCRTR